MQFEFERVGGYEEPFFECICESFGMYTRRCPRTTGQAAIKGLLVNSNLGLAPQTIAHLIN